MTSTTHGLAEAPATVAKHPAEVWVGDPGERRRRRVRVALRYLVLVLVAIIFVFPLLFMVMSSLKPQAQLLSDVSSLRAFLPVGDISLDNYQSAFRRAPVATFVFNSVLVTGLTVIFCLFICSLAAFSFVFLEWRGREVLLTIIIATLIIPFETIAIPLLLIVSQLPWVGWQGLEVGWLNTYRVQIIPWIADGLTIFLFVQYFKDLPRELIEASRVEGASWWQIYRRVVMPLSGPVLATAAILKFLIMYNQYLWPLIVVQQETVRPVMVGLGYFFQLNVAWGEVMAYLTIITLPVLAFYLVLQRAFIASIASTGVKG
jgi:multiple sugar transport system permease protein